jgi:orotidine-5'-phosphate decarboxylase
LFLTLGFSNLSKEFHSVLILFVVAVVKMPRQNQLRGERVYSDVQVKAHHCREVKTGGIGIVCSCSHPQAGAEGINAYTFTYLQITFSFLNSVESNAR